LLDQTPDLRRKPADLLERRMEAIKDGDGSVPDQVGEFLELAGSAWLSYRSGKVDEKRELLLAVTSNRVVAGKYVEFTLHSPFDLLAKRSENAHGDPYRDVPRTLDNIFDQLVKFVKYQPPPSVSVDGPNETDGQLEAA
jgi:hypothetical protein